VSSFLLLSPAHLFLLSFSLLQTLLRRQVTQPYLVGISTYFAIILYREFAVLARASVSKAVEGLGGAFRKGLQGGRS